ncbi:MAG: hypothetical protein Ct9H90mP8_1300 [Pseudomonadota bacterium]|nr:MAG: hypothetical protein Ct9H90mP8_1300 [Pseudomonadota bacterium]
MRLQGRYKQQKGKGPSVKMTFHPANHFRGNLFPHGLPCEPASVGRRYLRWHKYAIHWCHLGVGRMKPFSSTETPAFSQIFNPFGVLPTALRIFSKQLVFQELFFPQNGPSTLFSELRLE